MNIKQCLKTLAVLFAMLVSFSASAKESVQELIFEEDTLEGTLLGPSGERIDGLTEDALLGLIQVRSDFIDRIVLSADNL